MSSHSLAANAAVVSPPPTGVILRRILALAAPTSLVAALQVISQLAETWLAARQGTAALAGWAVVLPFALLLRRCRPARWAAASCRRSRAPSAPGGATRPRPSCCTRS